MHLAFQSKNQKHPGAPPRRGGMLLRYFGSVLALMLTMAVSAWAQPTLEFVPATQNVDLNIGNTFSATIRVNGTGLVDAAEVHLTFDETVLQVTGLTAGSSLPVPIQAPVFDNNVSPGTIDYAAIIFSTDVPAGFDFLTIDFQVIGTSSPTVVDFDGALPSKVSLDGPNILDGTTPLTVNITSVNTAPVVNITAPTDGATITRGQNFALTATVTDAEEPGLGSTLGWSSSDVAFSGSQTGLSITDQLLEPGPQTITASITDGGGLVGTDEITVNVSCPQVSFVAPAEGGSIEGTSVDVEVSVSDLLFGTVQAPNEHLHFFINPPDINNLDQTKRISTANNGPQTSFTFDENSGALAFDGNGNGIQLGANTIVVVAAAANHSEFTCNGAKAIVNFTVTQANSVPEITVDATATVNEAGTLSVPLAITDADGDNLTVAITSVSNEPQDLQSANSGKQVDPFPTTAAGFLAESAVANVPGSYTSSLDFTPTFGDGGSNGDGNAVYTVTIEVQDEDGNTITETLDVTVNDVDQVVASTGTTRIEAESFDEQGPDNGSPANSSDNNGIGVEIDATFINIGFTNAGDFVEYEIDVQTAGSYKLDFFLGVPAGANKGMEISSDGNLLTTFNPTATGGFGNYQTQSVTIALPAGPQTLRFDWVGATAFQFNIDYFELSPSTAPVIAAVDDQEIDEGATLSVPVTVTGGDAPNTVEIVIYDKSVPGGTNSPFTPAATVPASAYTFTESPANSGIYVLDWPTAATDGKSYEARVTADDGINPVAEEVFQINVAQDILDIILARTFSTPITPFYGANPPAGQFAIEPAGNIGYIDAGEFAEYLIDVPAAGAYELRVNASKGNNTGGNPAPLTVSEESGGGFSSIGTLPIANNGWTNFSDYTTTVIFASAGIQRLRFDFGGGMNINEFEFTEFTGTIPPVFTATIPNQVNLEGDAVVGPTAEAIDPDGGAVTYSDNGTLPPGLSINTNTGEISGTISAGAAANSPYTVVITVTDDEPEIETQTFDWIVEVPANLPLCVNCGDAPSPITAFGRTFTTEQYLASIPANTFNKLTTAIAGTLPGSGEEALFQRETYGDPLAYAIPTGNGSFTVELYLVELYIGSDGGGSGLGAGDRVFNIDVEGQTETGVDLFSEYGPLVAATKTYAVTVADGILNIDLDATTDNAKLTGFCITPTADFTPNAAPVVTIQPQEDLLDCDGDGEDITLTASATDEQGDMTAAIIWKDENGAEVGTGATLSLTAFTGSATYTAEVTDATPATGSESITVTVLPNTAPSLTNISANPGTIIVGSGVSLAVTASDNEDDDNTLVVTWSSDLETANGGVLGTGLTLNPVLTVEGTHTITASVTDACGVETTETVQVVVGPPVPCIITAIEVGNISACNNNGTDANLEDDTFTADITVTFNESAPTTGNLVLGEEATGSVAVADITGNSYTFVGVTMPADGTTIIVSAEFSDEPTCKTTNINAGTAPEACSVEPCLITDIFLSTAGECDDQGTADPADDTFFQLVFVIFDNAPASGTLQVTGSGSTTIDLSTLNGPITSVGFSVEIPADGAPINLTASILEIPNCSFAKENLGNAVEPCSVPDCSISAIDVTNFSVCNDQTTADAGDDTFTADVTVTFASAPATGTLDLSGDGTASVDVTTLVGTTHTFVGVEMSADGSPIGLIATFSDDTACSFTNLNAGTAPEPCSIAVDPCARVAFDTQGGLAGSSTFGGGLFITNNSVGPVNIASVSIDLSTAVFPNMVFDPVGTAGDATAQCVTIVSQTGGNSNVGLTIPGNNGTGTDPDCVDPFSDPNGPGGYNVMTLDFTEFEPGETVNIAVDVDPRSIEGFNSAGNAGAIAGSELIGATVTVTYSNGATSTRQLWQVGNSVVNSENFFNGTTEACAAPSLEVGGVTGEAQITETAQTATITGPANAEVEVLVYGTTLEDLAGPAPVDPFEMNKAQSIQTVAVTLDENGTADVNLDLTGTSDEQIYYIVATVLPAADDCGQSACDISNVVRLQIIELTCAITDITVTNVSLCDDAGTPAFEDDFFTADVTVSFENIPTTGTLDLSGDGTASVNVSTLVGTTHTFLGVEMAADGSAISLTAGFSDDTACTFSNEDAGPAPAGCSVDPCARVAFDTQGNLPGSSTFGGGLFITNNSVGAANITSVSIDLSTAVFPNMVFDPVGTAGDATAQCVTIVSQTGGNANVGLTIPGNNGSGTDPDCVDPFSDPNGPGGYNVMTLEFTEFEPGETVNIAVDVDPRSIEGFNSAGNAGAIAGSELIGSTVTVTYSNGTTSTRQLWQVGNSVVNSENLFNATTEACAAPSLEVGGITANGQVFETAQTANISGPANAEVEVLVYGTTIEDLAGNAPTDPFEMNKAQSIQATTVTLSGAGTAQINLDLTGTSDQQIYYIVATVLPAADDCGQSACDISNVVRLQIVDPPCAITAITVGNISACDDVETPDLGDDIFTADVTVTFENIPATGTLDLSGDGVATIDVASLSGGSHTFIGVEMAADGSAISLSATFSDDTACTFANADAGTAPEACSVEPCAISDLAVANISACNDQTTPDLGDDTFTADVTVSFANIPTTGTLDLSGDAEVSIDVASLSGTTYTFVGVEMAADGSAISLTATFSDDTACTFANANAGTAPEACSVQPPDVSFWLEAECAELGTNWVTLTSGEASNGEFVTPFPGLNSLSNPPADVPANQVKFTLELATGQAADYYLFGRINAPSNDDNSFWVRVNGGAWVQWWQGLNTENGFDWREVLNSPFSLTEGVNTIEFAYREDGTQLDKIYLSTDSAIPTELGPEGVNCIPNEAPIAAFTADPLTGNAPLLVSFDASASSDSDGTIVSYNWQITGPTSASFTEDTPLTSFTFDVAGTYIVSLTVVDNDGASSTNTAQVTIVVDEVPDADEDGVPDATDNCPNTPNADQADLDGDTIGDVCDDDADGDGFDNTVDCDDFNAAINPDATDIPDNGIDEDCDGEDATNSGSGNFWLEAECAVVGSNWITVSDGDASNGEYVTPANGNNSLANPPADIPANQVEFTLNLTAGQAGDFYLFARIEAPTSDDNSFWVRVNGGNWIQWWQGLDTQNGFEWKEVLNSPFGLVEGDNTIEFAYREDGTQLDKIYLSGDAALPTAIGPEGVNCTANIPPVAAFIASPLTGTAPLTVNFSALDSEDPDGTVVTYNWDFGPATAIDDDPLSNFTYNTPGTYVVTLTVVDNDGATSLNTASVTIVVEEEVLPDLDEDGVPDDIDNCVSNPNPDQADLDNDGIGDVCDTDADGDGFNAGVDCDDFNAAINPDATDIPDNGIDEDCDGEDATTGDDVAIWLEAECAEVGSNWETTTDASASNGAYVAIQDGLNSLFSPPASTPANIVKFTFELAQAGDFYVAARVQAPTSSDDSFWVRINGGNWIQWWQGVFTGTEFDWRQVVQSPFSMSAGTNTIEFAYREDGALLDKILISTDDEIPTGLGGTAPACDVSTNLPPVASFFATPTTGTAPLTVSFDASASSDPDGTVVIYTWDFGPVGGSDNSPQISYTFDNPGTYVVSLVVTDNEGATSTNTETVTIVVNPAGDPDADQDGVPDAEDNCPNTPNPNQADLDNDGIGDVCDPDADGDGFDQSIDCDDFNADVNNGAIEICDGIDNDCDGLIDEDGVCDGCTQQLIDFNNFDNTWGIWNDGGVDCRRNANDAPFAFGGTGKPVRLRDNTNSSVMTTDDLDLTAYTELTVDFTYLTISFDNQLEDFWLQISLDGGQTFTTVEEWNLGDEFDNGIRYFDAVTISGPFSANTQLRFRCDASGNNDQVYIDNVEISGCFDLEAFEAAQQLESKAAKEALALPSILEVEKDETLAPVSTNLQLFPNPVADELSVRFGLENATDVTLIVTDLQGRRISLERVLNAKGTMEQKIAVERYPAGIYLLHLITPEGKQTKKFVVTRN